MSNFEVGDRVVVVDSSRSLFLSRGEVVEMTEGPLWPYVVQFPKDVWGEPIPYAGSELELEGVYDALSAKPAEEVFSSDPEVDSRLVEEFLEVMSSPRDDVINSPSHYADGWSNGAEVIDITEHLNFNRGNAVKYLSRAGKKGGPEKELEDLQKALWYVRREVERLGGSV